MAVISRMEAALAVLTVSGVVLGGSLATRQGNGVARDARPAGSRAASAARPVLDAPRLGFSAEEPDSYARWVAAAVATAPMPTLAEDLDQLTPEVRERVLRQIGSRPELLRDCDSLRASPGGRLYYACRFPHFAARGAAPRTAAASVAGGFESSSAAVWRPSDGVDAVPIRHSRPGAPNVIYLHFAGGYTVENSMWNDPPNVKDRFTTQPFDRDGSPARFSEDERATMIEIWARLAEDFFPFDVDVTTERPSELHARVALVVITSGIDTDGDPIPYSPQLAPAIFDGFNHPNYLYLRPATIVYANEYVERQTFDERIADVIAHELGHNLGLSHDGTVGQEYYGGHGTRFPVNEAWGPIMGSSSDNSIMQWSKGEYARASNLEDDLAIIRTKLGVRPDDVGNDPASASALAVTATATTRFDGFLGDPSDVDVFAFDATAGEWVVNVDPFVSTRTGRVPGGNVDMKLELLDAAGRVFETADPTIRREASIRRTLAAGRHYVRVTPTGWGSPLADPPSGYTNYGSIGQYFLSVRAAAAPAPTPTPTPTPNPPPASPPASSAPPATGGGGGAPHVTFTLLAALLIALRMRRT